MESFAKAADDNLLVQAAYYFHTCRRNEEGSDSKTQQILNLVQNKAKFTDLLDIWETRNAIAWRKMVAFASKDAALIAKITAEEEELREFKATREKEEGTAARIKTTAARLVDSSHVCCSKCGTSLWTWSEAVNIRPDAFNLAEVEHLLSRQSSGATRLSITQQLSISNRNRLPRGVCLNEGCCKIYCEACKMELRDNCVCGGHIATFGP
jgi:rubrerythrin